MSNVIKDGTGTGRSAKVDNKNRLHTSSTSRGELDDQITRGNAFIIATPVISITDSNEVPMIYIKNNDDRILNLNVFIMTAGDTTGGTGNAYVKTYAQPDPSSTIITEAKQALVGNANPTSAKQFEGLAYYGETGDTIVGGIQFVNFILQAKEGLTTPTYSALNKGASAIYAYTPPSGNTDCEVSLILVVSYQDEEL